MNIDNINIGEIIKIAAIFFALFHFLIGIVLVSRITSMNNVFASGNRALFKVINYIYLFILLVVLLLVILI